MNNKILFLIIGEEIKYLQNSTMDHREWYVSLGYDVNVFDQVVRGFIMDNKIIFYKGNFQYDDSVILAAKKFTPHIRYTLNNSGLEPYCGLIISSFDSKWEPVLKINENEITGFQSAAPEPVIVKNVETGPALEIKNDYTNEKFIKTAMIVTGIVFILCIVIKIYLFSNTIVLQWSNFTDILLVIGQVGLLGATLFGYIKKMTFPKYTGIIASVLLIITLDIWDIIVGILYFLFCIDQNYYTSAFHSIKKLIKKNENKEKSS